MNSDKWLREWQQPNLKYRHSPTYEIVTVRRSSASQILCKSELSIYIYMVHYNCTYKGIKFKLKLQTQWNLTGHSMITPPLCYGPAIFFCHLHLIALSFPQGKVWYGFTGCYYFLFFHFLKTA